MFGSQVDKGCTFLSTNVVATLTTPTVTMHCAWNMIIFYMLYLNLCLHLLTWFIWFYFLTEMYRKIKTGFFCCRTMKPALQVTDERMWHAKNSFVEFMLCMQYFSMHCSIGNIFSHPVYAKAYLSSVTGMLFLLFSLPRHRISH